MSADRPPPQDRKGYAPSERHLYGATATLVDPVDGHMLTVAFPGMTTRQATLRIAAAADRYGMLVRTISHPLSILQDLDGRYMTTRGGRRQIPEIVPPEAHSLGAIGRNDLLEWIPASRSGLRDRRARNGQR